MTQVEKIKAKIEKLRDYQISCIKNNYRLTGKPEENIILECNKLLSFINSLQAEPVSEDLKEEITRYFSKNPIKHPTDWVALKNTALHFAKWQKKQDQKTIELAEDHAMLAGMERMKEEMLKDAKCVKVYDDWTYGKDADRVKQPAIKLRDQSLQIGSEVKLIIIKEEQV